jgi:hypothetical protein
MAFKKRGRPRGIRTTLDLSRPEEAAELKERIQETAFPASTLDNDPVFNIEDKKKPGKGKDLPEIPEIFQPEQVAWVFNAYVGILSFIYSIILKMPWDVIFEELKFDDDVANDMAKPLARICSKHAPSEWAGMTDEIQLISQLGIYTAMSFKRVKMVQEKEAQKKLDAERTTPVQPMRRHDAVPA